MSEGERTLSAFVEFHRAPQKPLRVHAGRARRGTAAVRELRGRRGVGCRDGRRSDVTGVGGGGGGGGGECSGRRPNTQRNRLRQVGISNHQINAKYIRCVRLKGVFVDDIHRRRNRRWLRCRRAARQPLRRRTAERVRCRVRSRRRRLWPPLLLLLLLLQRTHALRILVDGRLFNVSSVR